MLINSLKQVPHRFFNAMAFYTRLPTPNWVSYSPENLNRASAYFPLMGLLLALWCFLVFSLSQLLFPTDISILISMISGILFTGAFHEDGFADSCDGFGGGWAQQDILRIMKDSRLGTYGVTGLVSILAIKFFALLHLAAIEPLFLLIALLAAHGLSRALAISFMLVLPYVQDVDVSKSKPIAQQAFKSDMLLAWITALIPLYWLPTQAYWALLSVLGLSFFVIYRYFKQRLDGYTGDALGAAQQVFEALIYLTLLALMT